jgi:hypothetical protein
MTDSGRKQNPIQNQGREVAREWVPAATVVLFLISTTLFDTQIMLAPGPKLIIAFALGLVGMQGYVLWYYVKRFRPASKKIVVAEAYWRLFAIAMIGTTLVALVGAYAIRLLLHQG